MNSLDIGLLAVSFVLFIGAPYFPSFLYTYSFTNVLVPFLLLCALLISTAYSMTGSIGLLLAIAALFVEYRNRVLQVTKIDTPTYEQQLAPAPDLVPNEIHPEFKKPSGTRVSFRPAEDSGDNQFEPVGDSVNEKRVMASPRIPEETEKLLIEKNL